MSLPGREIKVSSWLEFIEALHSPPIIELDSEEGNHLRSPYVCRGMGVASWGLRTSLQRPPKTQNIRPKLIEGSPIVSEFLTTSPADEVTHNGTASVSFRWQEYTKGFRQMTAQSLLV